MDLRQKLAWARTHPDLMREIGQQGRQIYEGRYTAAANYGMLMDIYAAAGSHPVHERTAVAPRLTPST